MLRYAGLALLTICLTVTPTRADELLWARRSMVRGLTTIERSQDGGALWCTRCLLLNNDPVEIRVGAGVDPKVVGDLDAQMSTLWVVLFSTIPTRCKNPLYTVSLNTHRLEEVDLGPLDQCGIINVSIAEKRINTSLGMELILTDSQGHHVVRDVE